MKRMVDDKEIREFDDRITALEQGGTGETYTAGNGINIDSDNEISVDTNTIATISALQSFTQSFGGALTNIFDGTTTVGKARQDALGRTIDEYYGAKLTAGNGINIDNNNEISVDSNKVVMTSGNQTLISGYKSFQESGNDSKVTIYPNTGSIFLVNGNTGRSTSYKAYLIEASGGQTSTPSNFAIMNYYSGGYGRHEFDRTEQGIVATRDYVSNYITGTNNGVDWTNITIGNDTYDIPSATIGSHLFRHNIQLSGTTSTNQGYIVYFDIYNNDSTTYTSLSDVLDALNDGSTGFTGDRITCNGLIASSSTTQYRPLFIRKDANDSS